MEIFIVLIYLTGLLKMTAGEIPLCCRWPDLETLDCSYCGLKELSLPEMNITTLKLDNNFIAFTWANVFSPVKELRHLSLHHNVMFDKPMHEQTFASLEKLEILDLRTGPCLQFPDSIFTPMKSLRILKIGQVCNWNHLQYFPKLPTTLEHLEFEPNLESDGFGQNFSHLHRLKTLVLNGEGCFLGKLVNNFTILTNNTFEPFFPYLQTLEFGSCYVGVLNDVFSLFKGLKTLIFAGSLRIGPNEIFDSIAKMQFPSLETLIVDDLLNIDSQILPTNLSRFANLTNLSCRSANSEDLLSNFSNFPSVQSLSFLHTIHSSKPLNSSNSEHDLDLGTVLSKLIGSLSPSIISFNITFVLHYSNIDYIDDDHCSSHDTPLYSDDSFIKNPNFNRTKTSSSHSLKFIYARNFQTIPLNLNTISLTHDNVLYIDMSGTWVKKISGSIENGSNIQGLVFRGCRMESINSSLLDTLPSLIYLNFSDNKLNTFGEWNRLFRNASQIKTLDLSSNGLNSIPENIFEGLTSLEDVTLRNNPLGEVFIDMTKNKNLKMLDLRNTTLKPTEKLLKRIDSLQNHINHTLKLNLQDNYFECECNNLFFIRWLFETSVDVVGKGRLLCYSADPTYISQDFMQKLTSKCKDKDIKPIFSLVAPFASMAILLMVGLLVRNYRWTIKLKFYLLRRRVHYNLLLKRNDGTIPLVDDYTTYHAFVSYHHTNDYTWVSDELVPKAEDNWGLKLCIGQRDFIPGLPISENICKAIDKSRYVILVITPSFVTSEWCDFEMHMALVKGSQHLAIVYLEDVEPKEMSHTLKALMSNVDYIEYNNSPDGNALFWQRLKDKLTSHV